MVNHLGKVCKKLLMQRQHGVNLKEVRRLTSLNNMMLKMSLKSLQLQPTMMAFWIAMHLRVASKY